MNAADNKPMAIHIDVRRWFERANGSTYFSAIGYLDGEAIVKTKFSYGYGSQGVWDTWMHLYEHITGHEYDHRTVGPVSRYCREHGIIYTESVVDVARRKDLH